MPSQVLTKRPRSAEPVEDSLATSDAGPSSLVEKLNASEDVSSKPASTKRRKSKATTAPAQKKTAGIVYISRLPPGMTPQKVRHLMARWGDVGRVYAQRRDAPAGYNPNHQEDKKKDKKHAAANFTEAWVEFADKSIAKTVANMLNAQVIGGKKGDKWRDDIWTMKYLSGFKWEMLGEQVAYERQAHQSRLRSEIQRSRTEQGEYLKNVELARVLDKRQSKKAAAAETTSGESKNDSAVPSTARKSDGGAGPSAGKRSYKQRQVADRAHGLENKGMDSVLGSIFG